MFLPGDSFFAAYQSIPTAPEVAPTLKPEFEEPVFNVTESGEFYLDFQNPMRVPMRIIVSPETDEIFFPSQALMYYQSRELFNYIMGERLLIYPIYWFLILGTHEKFFPFGELECLLGNPYCPENIKDLVEDEIDRRENHLPRRKTQTDLSKFTYTYLMSDARTKFCKIGQSDNPVYREKTLQSDNPLITLIGAWVTSRQEEKILHKMFESKRIRGEWFDLTNEDVESIIFRYYGRMEWCA